MCFTPLASIVTAGTEFSIAGYLLKNLRSKKNLPVIAFVFLLGLYQLTEFLLCTTSYPLLWARVGFAIYTFLPALLSHSLTNLAGRTMRKEVYGIPIFFAGIALFYPNFILSSGCNLLHVSIRSFIFRESILWMYLYLSYYMIIPGCGFVIFVRSIRSRFKEVSLNRNLKIGIAFIPITILISQIYFLVAATYSLDAENVWMSESVLILSITLVAIALGSISALRKTPQFTAAMQCILASSFITTLLLYILIPQFAYDFSSIFCQFSLLYAVAAILITSRTNQEIV